MNAKWMGMVTVVALWMAPAVAGACGSYNSSDLCGTVEWIEVVDLGDDMAAIAVHGGFASTLSFSFDGAPPTAAAGHGKVLVACSKEDTWCLEGIRSIHEAEVNGDFIMVNAWNGFSAPATEGLPAGVWAEDALIDPTMMDPEHPNAIFPWGETAMVVEVETAASIPLCRLGASIGSGIHPGEPVIDLSLATERFDTGLSSVDPGFHGAAVVIDGAGEVNGSVAHGLFDGRELASVEGLLEHDAMETPPQTGCSEGKGASSPLSLLGGALVLLALGVWRREEALEKSQS